MDLHFWFFLQKTKDFFSKSLKYLAAHRQSYKDTNETVKSKTKREKKNSLVKNEE